MHQAKCAVGYDASPNGAVRIGLLLSAGALGLICFLGGQAWASADERIDAQILNGRLTLKADNAAVGQVLRRVAQILNARLSITGRLSTQPERWDLRAVPIAEAVTRIARPSSILRLQRHATAHGDEFLVREIFVFGSAVAAEAQEPVLAQPSREQRIKKNAHTLTSAVDGAARRSAAIALGEIGTDASVKALDRALGDADSGVRLEVVASLGRIGSDEALRLVGQVAMGSRDPELIAAARRVLEESGSQRAAMMLLALKAQTTAGSPTNRRSAAPR